MPALALKLLDHGDFPLVRLDATDWRPAHGRALIDDLETLIEHGQPFVLIIQNGAGGKQKRTEDDKTRMLWFKANNQRLATCCRASSPSSPTPPTNPGPKNKPPASAPPWGCASRFSPMPTRPRRKRGVR
ncbi:hypothetical protein ASALC70_03782 [Alcanivorax sp. ALC70]|nr:hypothetical protein ASALC70_03782 [Alcanivorax sp. ALC70]